MQRLSPFLVWLALLAQTPAWAQTVQLAGLSGDKALLVINGEAPRFLSPGQTLAGVRLISLAGDNAVVEVAGQRNTLRMGQSPIGLSAAAVAAAGNRVVLEAGPGGHFVTPGQINGRHVQFMVDTGATVVSLGRDDAARIGLKHSDGQPVTMTTANGAVQGYQLKLDSVKVGDAILYNVPAVVMPVSMPYVLLGNSFLSRFQLRRDNIQMILEKRY